MHLRKERRRYGYGVAPSLVTYSFSRAVMQPRIGAFIPWSEARAINVNIFDVARLRAAFQEEGDTIDSSTNLA
jgi:hypothetical protein